jgi:mannose-6-phosphate isomerase-like protein (cupin superfamily)
VQGCIHWLVSSDLLTKEPLMVESFKDASHLYETEHRETHAAREGFRINELTISPSQKVPWHYHTKTKDIFFVLEGEITIYLREPKEMKCLLPGEIFEVGPKRPHLVANSGTESATFLVLQGIGEYDYVPLT